MSAPSDVPAGLYVHGKKIVTLEGAELLGGGTLKSIAIRKPTFADLARSGAPYIYDEKGRLVPSFDELRTLIALIGEKPASGAETQPVVLAPSDLDRLSANDAYKLAYAVASFFPPGATDTSPSDTSPPATPGAGAT
jgi:hypothetical protein